MPLWKYLLNKDEVNELRQTLRFTSKASINPKDVALYYAHWWKHFYNGGIPSKQEVFKSVGGNTRFEFSEDEFYKLARKGAQMLRVKWIKKQNTLYFKTLLLQGGLPLKHISENSGKYKAFLEAVLEEQPETVEDFMFNSNIVELLPKSSQNEVIYENCLEIVKSILNEDGAYDELLETEKSLKDISSSLKIKKATLQRKERCSKPKNYWLLSFENEKLKISLRLGFSNTYSREGLSDIFGFNATERNYQFYLDDNLVCVFRKLSNEKYKTDWYNLENINWEPSIGIPNAYVLSNNDKTSLPNFLQHIPRIDKPTLWSRFTDKEWRLIKGKNAPNKEAALLFPKNWNYKFQVTNITIYNHELFWMPFEGEAEIILNQEFRKYLSGVKSFDWIIQNQKPNWMLKSNIPVVNSIPNVLVFDDAGYDVKRNRFKVYIRKHKSNNQWEDISRHRFISFGCYDLKIEKDNVVAYDTFYNIENLNVNINNQTINSAIVNFNNINDLEFKLNSSNLLEIIKNNNELQLSINTAKGNIPRSIKGSLGYPNKKQLYFDLQSPFQGMAITNKEGDVIDEQQPLSLADLYGMRILSTSNIETHLTLRNTLKPNVVISKEIKESNQPLITYKDDIVRLFYLADAMEYKNTVTIELSEGNSKKNYKISGFSHTLDVEKQLESKVSLYDSNDELELFAIPVNCCANDIQIIPLSYCDSEYLIPQTDITKQFIIISSKNVGKQLMPRFANTGDFFLGVDKNERITNFHKELNLTGFDDDIWKQVLEYFKICTEYDLPFSTFDQLRAISKSSQVASRAFLFLGINQNDTTDYIQKEIIEMEKDLGFCFHWINKLDWAEAIEEVNELYNNKYFTHIIGLISLYMGETELHDVFKYISSSSIEFEPILQSHIRDLRSQLGVRVLKELPYNSPKTNNNYGIHIEDHSQVRLLLQSPIAVAESISGIESKFPIWGGDEKREVIRRNIQYSHYLNPSFYNRTILHVLKKI